MPFQQLHLRVNDSSGRPTPARLRITDADGDYYPPHGRLQEFTTAPHQNVGGNVYVGTKPWSYIDGACEILLPPGDLLFEVAKGPEFIPIDERIHLLAGKMALRLTLERWSDVRQQGWYAGDLRAHDIPPHAALLEGQAEDLAIIHLLARETPVKDAFGKSLTAIPNLLAFSGQAFALQTADCDVAVNTHNVHPELGSLGLLHCHRVVYPLTFHEDDWTLEDWCDQCHRKKGLVVWTNPQHQTSDFLYGEPLADLILGKVDAFEVTFWEDSPFDAFVEYYRLLNAGLVVPLAGASAKESNGVVLGIMRTYAQLAAGQAFEHKHWIEAVRQGRSYVSNGPLLHCTIDGIVPGTHLQLSSDAKPLQVRAEATCGVPFEVVELLWNGEVITQASADSSFPYRALLEYELPVQSGWLAARCRGATQLPSRPSAQRIFAHTSPVALHVADAPSWARPDALEHLVKEVDAMARWAQGRPRLMQVLANARAKLARPREGI